MIKILFVCLGNICRSPAAEGIMKKMVADQNLEKKIEIDSAGTSNYHIGEAADGRMSKAAAQRGYLLTSRGRQIQGEDLTDFDYIIAMDNSNYKNILRLDTQRKYHHKIFELKEFTQSPGITEVPDPYYGGEKGFQTVIDILEEGCHGLLKKICDQNGL